MGKGDPNLLPEFGGLSISLRTDLFKLQTWGLRGAMKMDRIWPKRDKCLRQINNIGTWKIQNAKPKMFYLHTFEVFRRFLNKVGWYAFKKDDEKVIMTKFNRYFINHLFYRSHLYFQWSIIQYFSPFAMVVLGFYFELLRTATHLTRPGAFFQIKSEFCMLCCVRAETLPTGCRGSVLAANCCRRSERHPAQSQAKCLQKWEKTIDNTHFSLWHIKYGFIDSDTNCGLGMRWAICRLSRVTHHMLPNYVGGRNCYHHHWAGGVLGWSVVTCL